MVLAPAAPVPVFSLLAILIGAFQAGVLRVLVITAALQAREQAQALLVGQAQAPEQAQAEAQAPMAVVLVLVVVERSIPLHPRSRRARHGNTRE